jgi:hypothetical protein
MCLSSITKCTQLLLAPHKLNECQCSKLPPPTSLKSKPPFRYTDCLLRSRTHAPNTPPKNPVLTHPTGTPITSASYRLPHAPFPIIHRGKPTYAGIASARLPPKFHSPVHLKKTSSTYRPRSCLRYLKPISGSQPRESSHV